MRKFKQIFLISLSIFIFNTSFTQQSQTYKRATSDTCLNKFVTQIFHDLFYKKNEYGVVRMSDMYKSWEEVVSTKLFYNTFLNGIRKEYWNESLKDSARFMYFMLMRYFPNRNYDVENELVVAFKERSKKDTLVFNTLKNEGLDKVLKKYFIKKHQLKVRYKPIQMQIFWYLFDNKIRVVTPENGKSYYILFDCNNVSFDTKSWWYQLLYQ